MSETDQCARCGGDCPFNPGCPECGGCENTGVQPCPGCQPDSPGYDGCPDCGRGDCTGEDCDWGDDLDWEDE